MRPSRPAALVWCRVVGVRPTHLRVLGGEFGTGGLGPYDCRSHGDSARSDGTILPVGHPPPARPPPKPTVCLPQPRLGPLGKRRLRVGYSLGEYTWVPLLQRAAPLHAFSSPKALKHTLDQVPRGFGHQVRRRTPSPVPRAAIFCRTSCSATGGFDTVGPGPAVTSGLLPPSHTRDIITTPVLRVPHSIACCAGVNRGPPY